MRKEYYYFIYEDGEIGSSEKKLTLEEAQNYINDNEASFYISKGFLGKLIKFDQKLDKWRK